MAEVRFEHVTKSYTPDTNVISDLNLVVKNAEFLVLVGPSGCGKSTALRMIAGLESITEGDLFIGDRRVNDIEPKDRDIAMVFQNYALYPHMTVYDNLAISLKLRHLKRQEIELRVQTRAEISRLHQATGTTFVYVTHDLVEAMTMGDRIAVLNAGVIQQLGTPQELYDTPTNLFVAGTNRGSGC